MIVFLGQKTLDGAFLLHLLQGVYPGKDLAEAFPEVDIHFVLVQTQYLGDGGDPVPLQTYSTKMYKLNLRRTGCYQQLPALVDEVEKWDATIASGREGQVYAGGIASDIAVGCFCFRKMVLPFYVLTRFYLSN